jgi:excisionase family DNA binding protein
MKTKKPRCPVYLTVTEVALLTRSCKKTVIGWIKSGKIPAVRLPQKQSGTWLLDWEDVKLMLEEEGDEGRFGNPYD